MAVAVVVVRRVLAVLVVVSAGVCNLTATKVFLREVICPLALAQVVVVLAVIGTARGVLAQVVQQQQVALLERHPAFYFRRLSPEIRAAMVGRGRGPTGFLK